MAYQSGIRTNGVAANGTAAANVGQLKLKHIDYIELYVGNPLQASHYYRHVLGFQPIAYAGLETRQRDRASFVMKQGAVQLVLTGAITGDDPVARHILQHGEGVKDIAFMVEDAAYAFRVAVQNGAQRVLSPTSFEDDYGKITKATISAYGDTVHSFVERKNYAGPFLPGFAPLKRQWPAVSTGICAIDHVAVGIEQGKLEAMANFYRRILSFHDLHAEMVSTEYSGMNSKVVAAGDDGQIKFPLIEPAVTKPHTLMTRRSQIDEYLHYNDGPGAQHIALLTNDIIHTVQELTRRGLDFVQTPTSYYQMLEQRLGRLDRQFAADLERLSILIDRDDWGTLLQIFSRHLQSRPTLFLEIIQRQGAKGFGSGNIKALFQAIEREQALREAA